MSHIAYWLASIQFLNTLLINMHVFNPGRKKELFFLIILQILFLTIEVFEYKTTAN